MQRGQLLLLRKRSPLGRIPSLSANFERIRPALCLSLVTALGVAAAPVDCQAQAPTTSERLLLAQLPGFKVDHQSSEGNLALAQWVPIGETSSVWTRMLTVQVRRHTTADPASFLNGVAAQWAGSCPASSHQPVAVGRANGYVASTLLIRCPRNPKTGKPETTALRAIKGNDALYVIQMAFRSNPPDRDLADGMRYLTKVTVCDTRDFARHPCPSFAQPTPKP